MSFPCRTSKNGGQHKWSILKFTTKDRDEFVQSCRYCGTIRWGKFEMVAGQLTKEIHWKYSDGLEKLSSKSEIPTDETGSIGPKDAL